MERSKDVCKTISFGDSETGTWERKKELKT